VPKPLGEAVGVVKIRNPLSSTARAQSARAVGLLPLFVENRYASHCLRFAQTVNALRVFSSSQKTFASKTFSGTLFA